MSSYYILSIFHKISIYQVKLVQNEANIIIWATIRKTKINNKNAIGVAFRLISHKVGKVRDESNFLYKSLLNNRQVRNLQKASANNQSTYGKLSKT